MQRPWDKIEEPTCNLQRPACLDKSEGGQVMDNEEGQFGGGQIMASLLWSLWHGFEVSSPNSALRREQT